MEREVEMQFNFDV